MEKRRIRLEINGVVCGLITQESEEYMQSLAGEVGDLMKEILAASPFITREAAALTAALSYCDDAKKNGVRAAQLNDRVEELEVEAEIWQEDKEKVMSQASLPSEELREKLETLERENARLSEAALAVAELEGKVRRLSDENTALQEAAREVEELGERARRLACENEELQKAAQRAGFLEEQMRGLAEEKAVEEDSAGRIAELEERLQRLSTENAALREAAEASGQKQEAPPEKEPSEREGGAKKRWKNPLRHEELDQMGFVSFFEKGENGGQT